MAITVKHSKVSTIPDGDDASVVRPSDWNDDHVLVGLGTMAEQNANAVAITGGTISGVAVSGYVPTTTTITAGTGLTGGGDLSANRTLAIANTAVVAGNYGTESRNMTLAINAQGQITSAIDQPIEIANTQVTGLGTASTKDAGVALGVATLDASGKVPTSQIPLQGDLNYQGTWNATTNTPTLTSSVGTQGYYYVVDVAGTTNLNGITDWQIGDWAIYNGTVWQKVDNTDAVTSVNGLVGTVVLTTTNIAEGTNEYFTTARARTSISGGTGISYDNSTGVVTNSAPDQTVALTGAGTTTVTGTYPNFTITSNDEFDGDVVGPASATDNAIARFDTTTGKLIQNSIVTIGDTGIVTGVIQENFTPIAPPTYLEGKVFYDTDAKTLAYYNDNSQMTVNIGQESIVRVRNQTGSTIADGTVVYVNGATGNTPTIALAIATSSITSDIIGVTTTTIANNGFGYVTISGLVNGLDTSAFAEGDAVFLSATTAGAYTTTEPTRPNYSIQVGVVLRANPTVGTLLVSVQIVSCETQHIVGTMAVDQGGTGQTSYTNGQLLIGNTTGNTLTKATLTAGTGVSVTNGAGSISIANTAPDQVVSITGAGTTSVTGTYPNFTVTSNDQYVGTVTSVSALTIGTSGTDLSSTVANGTTTPVISLQVPTASATNRGALSSADWSTFNGKANAFTYTTNYVPYGQGTTTPNQSASYTFDGTTQTAPIQRASNGIVVNSKTVSASYSIASGDCGMSVGPVTVASGQSVTVASGSRWVVL